MPLKHTAMAKQQTQTPQTSVIMGSRGTLRTWCVLRQQVPWMLKNSKASYQDLVDRESSKRGGANISGESKDREASEAVLPKGGMKER